MSSVFDVAILSALVGRYFGTMTNETLVAVPLFVFMGVMLERSKIAEALLTTMGELFGSLRGGLGYSVVIVGALLAASTGIVGATIITLGMLTLPTLIRRGYDKSVACGAICASGTLGQIIPPSLILILLSDIMQLSVGTLFAAMLVRARSRDVLLPVLLYPMTVPVMIAGVRGTAALFQPEPDLELAQFWLALLVFFDAVFVTLALWTFEPLMTD